jgi:hypothetical protein
MQAQVPRRGPVAASGADVLLRVVALADSRVLMRACEAGLDDPVVFGARAHVPRTWPQWICRVWLLRRLARKGDKYPYVIEYANAPVGELFARVDHGTATAELSIWLGDHAYNA